MTRQMKTIRQCCLLVFVLFGPSFSSATTVYSLDFSTLVKLSESVVLARVTKVSTDGIQKPRQIVTVVELDVKECLMGECATSLTLRQVGGQHRFSDGLFTQKVVGMPHFQTGERVLLFLERTDTDRLVVTGLAQGKFTVLGEGDDAALIRSLHGLNMLPAKGKFKSDLRHQLDMPTRLDVLRIQLTQLQPVLDIRPVRIDGEGTKP